MFQIVYYIFLALILTGCAVSRPIEKIKIGSTVFYVESEETFSGLRLLKGKTVIGNNSYDDIIFLPQNCSAEDSCRVLLNENVDLDLHDLKEILPLVDRHLKNICENKNAGIAICPSKITLNEISFDKNTYKFWYGVLSGHPGDKGFSVAVRRENGGYEVVY
jgi:hypothetical protein